MCQYIIPCIDCGIKIWNIKVWVSWKFEVRNRIGRERPYPYGSYGSQAEPYPNRIEGLKSPDGTGIVPVPYLRATVTARSPKA